MQRGLCERKCPDLKGSMRASPLLHSRGGGFPYERLHQEAIPFIWLVNYFILKRATVRVPIVASTRVIKDHI